MDVPKGMNGADKLHVAVWLGLSNKKALEKLEGLMHNAAVEKITIFRQEPISQASEKCIQKTVPGWLRKSKIAGHFWIAITSFIYVIRHRPALCIGISLYPHSIFAAMSAFMSGSAFGVWFIGTDLYRRVDQPLARKFLLPILRKAGVAMSMGYNSSMQLRKFGFPQSRVVIGKNAYRLGQYTPDLSEAYRWDVVFTGRLDRYHKDLDLFVESIAAAACVLPSLRCAIVGEGKDRSWLEKQIALNGVEKNIILTGATDNVFWYLQRSRLFLLTSKWEGLPSSVVEAFSCGIPVIATNVGDISVICKNRVNSLVAQCRSSTELSNLIIEAFTDRKLMQKLKEGALETGQELKSQALNESIDAWGEAIYASLARV